MTPFEFFRTPIEIRRFSNGFYLNGKWQEGTRIALNADLVPGNIINMTINGTVFSPIAYNTSSANTMQFIAAVIETLVGIKNVLVISNNRQLMIVPKPGYLADVQNFTITGGVSQPVVSELDGITVIPATASIQPTKGIEVQLIPEGRRDSEAYKMYTSTEIYGIYPNGRPVSALQEQNPDQVTVLKGPFTGLVFEVIQIYDWQNNSNFNIVNHYKYIALRLNSLP